MPHLLFSIYYSQCNMECPEAHRVIRIPIGTTSENAHIGTKGLTLEIKVGPLFQGIVYPKCSNLSVTLDTRPIKMRTYKL